MLLVIDIGNTSTTYGFYRQGRIQGMKHVMTYLFPKKITQLTANKSLSPFDHAVVSSVVPEISLKIRGILNRRKGVKLWELGHDFQLRIKHKYKIINKLGRDRLCNVYGALKLYKPPFLIIDFGTAITCDFVSKKGVFERGLLLPGPEISPQVLTERTGFRPSVSFPKKARSLVGRSPKEGMQLGILLGVAAMTEGLIRRFKSQYGKKLRVIATGGLAPVICPLTQGIDVLDPLLTLRGLLLSFLKFRKNTNS